MENMKKEIRNRRILALIAIMVISFAYIVSGQITFEHRYDNRPDITTIYPTNPVEFGYSDALRNDPNNFFVSMYVDKISKDSSATRLYVTFNKNRDISKYELITIKFEDGSFKKLQRTMLIKNKNYAEYLIDDQTKDSFKWMLVDEIQFNSKNKDEDFYGHSFKEYNRTIFINLLNICSR